MIHNILKKTSLLVLCAALIILLSGCNTQNIKPSETKKDSEEILIDTFIEIDGIYSVKVVGTGNEERQDVMLYNPRHTYTIEYYSPTDLQYIEVVLDYLNAHQLKNIKTPPFSEIECVKFTFTYNNETEIEVMGQGVWFGKRIVGVDETYVWYEAVNDILSPDAFFDTIDRPPQTSDPDEMTSVEQNGVEISVPIHDGYIKFPDKTVERIEYWSSVYDGSPAGFASNKIIWGRKSYIKKFISFLEELKLDQPWEPQFTSTYGGSNIYIIFNDGTQMDIRIFKEQSIEVNGVFYRIDEKHLELQKMIAFPQMTE